jgi:hypothetical protein
VRGDDLALRERQIISDPAELDFLVKKVTENSLKPLEN